GLPQWLLLAFVYRGFIERGFSNRAFLVFSRIHGLQCLQHVSASCCIAINSRRGKPASRTHCLFIGGMPMPTWVVFSVSDVASRRHRMQPRWSDRIRHIPSKGLDQIASCQGTSGVLKIGCNHCYKQLWAI